MKTLFVRFFFVLMPCLFTACATMPPEINGNATGQVQTEFAKVLRRTVDGPLLVEKVSGVRGIGHVNSFGPVTSWQLKNRQSQIVGLMPVIENNALTAWKIDWLSAKKPIMVFGGYLEAQVPYILPEGASLDEVLKETWDAAVPKFHKLHYQNAKMIAPGVKRVDGKTIVYGLWYAYNNSNMSVEPDTRRPGQFKITDDTMPTSYRSPVEFYDEVAKRTDKINSITLPLPQIVMNRPELQLSRVKIDAEGPTIEMAPSHAEAQMFLVNLFDKDGKRIVQMDDKRKIAMGVVDSIIRGTTADKAGVKVGMLVKSINGTDIAGLTREEYEQLGERPFRGDFKLGIIDKQGSQPREIAIPMEKPNSSVKDDALP